MYEWEPQVGICEDEVGMYLCSDIVVLDSFRLTVELRIPLDVQTLAIVRDPMLLAGPDMLTSSARVPYINP